YVDNMADGKLAKAQNGTDITNKAQFIENLGVRSSFSGVIGMTRNATMNIPSASSSATFTADEIIVGTALGGNQYRIGLFKKTIDLTKNGVGGMDTGTVPDEGFVGIYAIYNPVTMLSGLLAVNATSVKLPEIYNGASMPDGYAASALLTVVPVKAGKFTVLSVFGRQVHIPGTRVYSGLPNTSGIDIPVSKFIPLNTRTISGVLRQSSTADGLLSITVSSNLSPVSGQQATNYVFANMEVSNNYADILIVDEGHIVASASNATSGNATVIIAISKYAI
ncbi:hypothetical protein O0557_16160, partial [Dickeya solani]|nr:hypothetical protein [Dickeya solani]MCZ0804338.1 hypothetical protein [Dickeya solani]